MDDLYQIIKSVEKKQKQRRTEDASLRTTKERYLEYRRKYEDDADENEQLSEGSADFLDVSEDREQSEQYREEQHHSIKIHSELQEINKKLKEENTRLKDWDTDLKKKMVYLEGVEKKLSDYAASLEDSITTEVEKRCAELEKGYELKLHQAQEETKKIRSSLKVIKKSNDTLKMRAAEDEIKLKKYEGKQTSSQNRISNLQKKIQLLTQQISDQAAANSNLRKEKKSSVKPVKDEAPSHCSSIFYENLGVLLQWITDEVLKPHVVLFLKNRDRVAPDDNADNVRLTNERVLKLIIFMPNILSHVASMNSRLQSSVVQFMYWSFVHLQVTQYSQRSSHSATYRRIGEVLFQNKVGSETSTMKGFFLNSDYVIKILSSLIILHTITQADLAAQVFNSLATELKGELPKEIFLEYHGTEMLLPMFMQANKVHLGYAANILMAMAVDSPYVEQFMMQLGTIDWVQAIMTILKSSSDITLMENISLILQRLSKLKQMRPIFDALQVKLNVTELLRKPHFDGEYLQLNLRSILMNIEAMRQQKEK